MCVFSAGPKLDPPKPAPVPAPSDAEVVDEGRKVRRKLASAESVRNSVYAGAIPIGSQAPARLSVKTALGV